MMIRKILVAIAMMLPTLISAQTIHWLTFIDTEDPGVGSYDIKGREVLYGHFVNVVNAAIAEKGYRAKIHDIYGKELSPQKCKEIVTNLTVNPEDIIVFYYIGHGTHGNVGGDKWPLMWMGRHWTSNDDLNYLVPLKWTHDQLKSKGARLTATIGMCCNSYQDIPRRETPAFGVSYGGTYLTDIEKQTIQNLFLNHKGDLLMSSASPGQSSYPGDTVLGPMDIFTCVLVKNFESGASDGELDWDSLFTDVSEIVDMISEGNQTPFFSANISETTAPIIPNPDPEPVRVDNVSSSSSDVNQDFLDIMGLALDNLIDPRQKDNARISQATELQNIFSPNAIVKVISQDGNIVVDKIDAKNYLGRLAMSRILLKVAPIDAEFKNDRIATLKVKEVYKK